jgi:hypothetical protein
MTGDDEPVVLFAFYHETLNLAQEALDAAGITYVRVDGSVVGPDRAEAERAFQAGEVRVFLGQKTASSAALNLFRARVSVCLDWSQRAYDYPQMLGRTCRRGQTSECMHFDLIDNALQRDLVTKLRAGESFHLDLVRFQSTLERAASTTQQPLF